VKTGFCDVGGGCCPWPWTDAAGPLVR